MKVVIVSTALLGGASQRKAEELARQPGVELTVLVPPSWRDVGRVTRLERAFTNGYHLKAIPLAFNGHFHYHFYPTLGRELARLRPDILHVDEEPYNLATFLAYAHGGRVGAKRQTVNAKRSTSGALCPLARRPYYFSSDRKRGCS